MDKKNKWIQIGIHLLFGAIVIGVIVAIFLKFSNFINGGIVSEEDLTPDTENLPETEALDYILPLITSAENLPEDDGETTIVCFGNAPFADDRDSADNLCNLIAEKADATVYNCSIPGSYMATYAATFDAGYYPMDAFSFYWLTTAFCMDNFQMFDTAQAIRPDFDPGPDAMEAIELLRSIDFNKVDVITLMYDGSDYLEGRAMYNDENFTDPQQFTGSMAAGIELIQAYYPHIRIIVMSPTYAYGVEEDGTYVSSDIKTYGHSFLSTYVVKQAEAAYELGVSFVDNLYGTIHENIASDYLIDHIHLNKKGRELVAERFVDALNMYPEPIVE